VSGFPPITQGNLVSAALLNKVYGIFGGDISLLKKYTPIGNDLSATSYAQVSNGVHVLAVYSGGYAPGRIVRAVEIASDNSGDVIIEYYNDPGNTFQVKNSDLAMVPNNADITTKNEAFQAPAYTYVLPQSSTKYVPVYGSWPDDAFIPKYPLVKFSNLSVNYTN
jgi:hypothetical protein